MAELWLRDIDETATTTVTSQHPLPVKQIHEPYPQLTVREMIERNMDWYTYLAAEGYQFYASDADFNDTVTGQTSAANTSPTFGLDIPGGTVCVPVAVFLGQTGSVAGDAISVIVTQDDVRRITAGTAEASASTHTNSGKTATVTAYSTVTASDVHGQRIMGVTVAQDVAPAEGISNELIWTPTGPDFLEGPASMLVYTFAGTTGPTWFWTLKWLEFPIERFGF